ncbi:Uma2 family endonuclease [Synechococcus sp. R8-2]|uniref:Uma2 family endonuclease n=1 Tax=Synechococcus sp. R8-2 TaxID=2291959 RepID=UPI0039C1254A
MTTRLDLALTLEDFLKLPHIEDSPAWEYIEILSPGQRLSRVIDNILHRLKHGSKLGWMVDLDDYSVLIFAPQQEPEICRADRQLKVIDGIQLALTPQQIFVLQYTTPAAWP